jgi:hypothetical protein
MSNMLMTSAVKFDNSVFKLIEKVNVKEGPWRCISRLSKNPPSATFYQGASVYGVWADRADIDDGVTLRP